jgi:hypothetical protein
MGLHALSVEMAISVRTRSFRRAASTRLCAPCTLVATACEGKYSHVGTCFIAAAWMTTSLIETARRTDSASRTSPIQNSSSSSKFE